jgi:hypothetical protein
MMFLLITMAQNNTKVLFEMTTATGCFHCPAGNAYIDSLAWLHPDKVVVLRYQLPLNSYDPIFYQDSADLKKRSAEIFPTGEYGMPGAYCNGKYSTVSHPQDFTTETIDSVYAIRSHFQLDLQHQVTADCDSLSVVFTITSDTVLNFPSGKLVAHLILMEDSIFFQYPPGNNGEKDFFFECRKFIPDVKGFQIPDQWTAGMSKTYTYKVPIPGYIYDLNNLYVLGFIQDKSTMHILQSAKDHQHKLPDYAGIDSHKSLVFKPFTCDTLLPDAKVFVKNMGTQPLTSFKLLHRVNSLPFDTIHWTGFLAPDSLVLIALPTLRIPGDGHKTITVKVIYPNNHWVVESFSGKYSAGIEVNVTPDEPPLHEYFTGTHFPYKGWFVDNPNRDGNTWHQNKAQADAGYMVNTLFLRSFTMMPGTVNEFYPPEISVHQMGSMTLYFDVAHVRGGDVPDTLEIFLSDDCGKTWNSVYSKTGDQFGFTSIPWPEWYSGSPDTTSASWKRQTVSLSGYQPDSKINLRFRYTKGGGNNIRIRNLYIGPNVGIAPPSGGSFTISPNPTRGFVTVAPENGQQILETQVYTIFGKLVLSVQRTGHTTEKQPLDLTNQPAGIYLVRLRFDSGWFTEKVVVNP